MSEDFKGALLFAPIYFLVSYLMIRQGLDDFRKSIASKDWTSTEGEIVHSEVIRRGISQPKVNIEYTYRIKGKKYSSKLIHFGSPQQSPWAKKENRFHVKAYPKGKKVDVYYNPESPDIAVLEPGFSLSANIQFMIFGIIFGILTIVVLVGLFLTT